MNNSHLVNTYFNEIFSQIQGINPKNIYIGIGCSLGHYTKDSIQTNQQYPNYFDNIISHESKKVVILIDPLLEKPLKLEEFVDLDLVLEDKNFRILNNSNLVVFAINDYFYFKESSDNQNCSHFLMNIINYVLSRNARLFVEDFSGTSISEFFDNYEEIFGEDFSKKVLFDITQGEGNCFPDFTKYKLYFDDSNNLVQLKRLKVCEIKKYNSEYFKKKCLERLETITNDFERQYRVINGIIPELSINTTRFEFKFRELCKIYNFTPFISIDNIIKLSYIIIKDILDAFELSKDILDILRTQKFGRDEMRHTLAPVIDLL
jgi:hypothetical protein